jgi:hypothetical protein
LEHLLYLNWSFIPSININQPITHHTDGIFKFWLQTLNLHEKLVLMRYDIPYADEVWPMPFWIIIIVLALARAAGQIWRSPLQIPHFCEILHLLIYKSSHIEQVTESSSNSHCLKVIDQISKSSIDDNVNYDLMVSLLHCNSPSWDPIGKWILIMSILYNVVEQFSDFIITITAEILWNNGYWWCPYLIMWQNSLQIT